ncbi:MAG: 2-oxo acid dehydrogenase subunit E2 [Deltaproteobacteria bacterium]|nr:2-oxo acid dehydrogenase subunit E2 [Deltaproteobacteria bacterium]
MIQEFKFPDVGEGIAEGEIVKWLVKEGDTVKEDQELVEIETDKALVTMPSPYAGKVVQLFGKPGTIIKVGDVLATLDPLATPPATKSTEKRKDAGTVVGNLEGEEILLTPEIQATPAVRALAKELGVDLSLLKGSGPGGRIEREDVEKAATQGTDPGKDAFGPVEKMPFRGVRRTIAKNVMETVRHVAAVTFMQEADITELGKERAKGKKERLTYLPFMIQAVIPALKAHPKFNASLNEELGILSLKKYYHIGIAVDTPEGLMVFPIKEADKKSLSDLAQELEVLAEKARSRTIDLAELKGSTFTITNYGAIGGSYGTPIIHYPEVAILGMGKIEDKPAVREGQIVIRKILPLSLTFDHRVVDGAESARFLNDVIQRLLISSQ